MSEPVYRVRRATVDDLERLRALWLPMGLPTEGLDRTVTAFQVVEDEHGTVCGTLGLEVSGRQGRVHGEAFEDFGHADKLRPLLWQRVQMVGSNRGVARYWTEESAPFWRQAGFESAAEAAMEKLPPEWGGEKSRWLTLQVWDEEAVDKTLAREMARFKQAEQEQLARTLRTTRIAKYAATILALILAIFVGILIMRLLQARYAGTGH